MLSKKLQKALGIRSSNTNTISFRRGVDKYIARVVAPLEAKVNSLCRDDCCDDNDVKIDILQEQIEFIRCGENDTHEVGCETCCGVLELTLLEESDKDNLLSPTIHFLLAVVNNPSTKCFVYYSICSKITKDLKWAGFESAGSFKNPNTGNTIEVLVMTLP